MIELKVVLLWLIRSYKISTPHDFEENTPLLEVILRPSLGVPVILEKRWFFFFKNKDFCYFSLSHVSSKQKWHWWENAEIWEGY